MNGLTPGGARRAALCAAMLAILLPAGALAAAGYLVCRPDYDFSVEVDGSYPRSASFYRSDVRGKFFVEIGGGERGFLLDMAARKVFGVPRELISASDGGLRVREGLPGDAPAYAFSVDGPELQFRADGRIVRILPALRRPPVIGPVGLQELLADRAEYREVMKTYHPNEKSIEVIRAARKPIELEVYFGTWCPHCKRYMPKLLRVVTEAGGPNLKVRLVGVPRMFATEPGPWKAKNIRTIPVVIVRLAGKEITRLGTHETSAPEIELASLLQALP
ncbi:MAG: hypothetical protein ACE5JH_09305 [Acidobacteriota bacterium]